MPTTKQNMHKATLIAIPNHFYGMYHSANGRMYALMHRLSRAARPRLPLRHPAHVAKAAASVDALIGAGETQNLIFQFSGR